MGIYTPVNMIWLVLLASGLASATAQIWEPELKFYDPVTTPNSVFNHLVVDSKTGHVYIGAVNNIYQLSPDLEVLQSVSTGPVNDSALCASDCSSNIVKKLTDNVNKVLLIDYASSRLVACGSALQGQCSVRNLNDISQDVMATNQAVVANDAVATTVAFIAPGPPNLSETQVMYVGVTYTGTSPHPAEIPTISSRSLETDRLFTIAQTADTSGTKIFVNSLSRERYPINYVYGFSSEGFSYFLTTQLTSVGSDTYYSKIVRVCQNDESYYSYTEIPIICTAGSRYSYNFGIGGDNVTYNLVQAAFVTKIGRSPADKLGLTAGDEVLIAAFSESDSKNRNTPSDSSGICVYSLKAIRSKFTENIQSCYKGHGLTGLDFITPSSACVNTNINSISEDFCGMDINTPLGGDKPIETTSAITFTEKLTAVTATEAGSYVVIFVGTARGHLKKLMLETPTFAFQYGSVDVDDGSPVNKDLYFDTQMTHLYVMTERKVSKIKITDCTTYTSCRSCIETQDPYCGWCTPQNKCSLRSDCQDAATDSVYWITYPTSRCTFITEVTPKQLPITAVGSLNVHIESLPVYFGQYKCVFKVSDYKNVTTIATRRPYGVSCSTPSTDKFPPLPAGQHSFTTKLSVLTPRKPEFVATNFTFFDCNTYSSCTECVSSPYPCDWCVDGHRCTHDTAENCRNDILVTGVSRIEPSYRSGPAFCPSINSTSSGNNEILIPFGEKKAITVKVHIIGQFIIQTRFSCRFNIEGRVMHVRGILLADTIYCDDFEFTYSSHAPNITASFDVIWGGSKPLDNPSNIHLHIYKCHAMADNCGMCLELPEKFGCGWCPSSNKCKLAKYCDSSSSWLTGLQTCPNPKIYSFSPRLGPLESGTVIHIFGTNLGHQLSDIYNEVTVAGVQCVPIRELYVRSRQIVCTLSSSAEEGGHDGPIVVRIGDYRAESEEHYKFEDPKINSIQPTYGPKSGGTKIHIRGEFLNAGSSIRAYINDLTCAILSVSPEEAICRTSLSNQLQMGTLRLHFDNATRTLEGVQFSYIEDPTVESIESGPPTQRKQPKGIPSGGLDIKVLGSNFHSIQSPQIYVYYDHRNYTAPCHRGDSTTELICESPVIQPRGLTLNPDSPLELEYGFIMDDVQSVKNLKSKTGNGFLLYPDPVYDGFENGVKTLYGDYLTLTGKNLDRVSTSEDVEVRIGDETCIVTSISREQLTCRLPAEDKYENKNNLNVVVKVGRQLTFNIGNVSYDNKVV